ncbi:hypothetical protein [Kitasatospora acidiphila]|uniref:hypothetical protein n=1 Tax=Kitasatospora acidiphila TaxID=2567942 RepID=UPI003C75972B
MPAPDGPTTPIRWTDEPYDAPYTIVGDGGWSNCTVTADTMFEQSSTIELLGRVNQQGRNNNGLNRGSGSGRCGSEPGQRGLADRRPALQ